MQAQEVWKPLAEQRYPLPVVESEWLGNKRAVDSIAIFISHRLRSHPIACSLFRFTLSLGSKRSSYTAATGSPPIVPRDNRVRFSRELYREELSRVDDELGGWILFSRFAIYRANGWNGNVLQRGKRPASSLANQLLISIVQFSCKCEEGSEVFRKKVKFDRKTRLDWTVPC